MNQVKLKEFIEARPIHIPLYALKTFQEFNLNVDELLLLLYLYNDNLKVFDPTMISNDLGMDEVKLMETVSNLEDKGILKIVTRKNDHQLMEEVLDLGQLFDKITLKIVSLLNAEEENSLNIHHLIEEEFNRRLTPLEHEMIDDWQKNAYSKELIKEAVKEASVHGVANLRYIDTILSDWSKKGIKTPQEITKNNEEKEKIEIINYDWLDDDEEEI